MYSFPDLEPVCCSMSSSNCCFLTCIQISQEAGQVAWYSHLLKNFPKLVVVHTVKGLCSMLSCVRLFVTPWTVAHHTPLSVGFSRQQYWSGLPFPSLVKCFGTVNKAEIDVFLKLSCFFDDPEDVGNMISVSSVFSKSRLNTWKFTVHILLKPGLQNFEHYFDTMWDECNCVVVWAFFGIAFLRDWNENWHSFSSSVATAEFSKFAGILRTASSLRIYSEISQTGYLFFSSCIMGFPGGTNGKESACQCRRCQRCRFDPWVRKTLWRGKGQPTPVFVPGKSHGQRSLVSYSPWGRKESDTTERLSTHAHTVTL